MVDDAGEISGKEMSPRGKSAFWKLEPQCFPERYTELFDPLARGVRPDPEY
jgi:hypothetical protein